MKEYKIKTHSKHTPIITFDEDAKELVKELLEWDENKFKEETVLINGKKTKVLANKKFFKELVKK